jgi:DNA invertase Pin-like site-specific DNA recombinase
MHRQAQLLANSSSTVVTSIRAAVYVRMSTEHQQYSIHNQMIVNQAYAIAHGMEIVRIYSDEGISGLGIERRAGLQHLMSDVRSGNADYSFVLVYDVSRWGRFQDTDQGAHYEFECRQQGIKIIYCAEPFDNDNTPMTAVIKSIKRAMAAEYSRELGVKVFQAQCTLARRGFDQGGGAPYGLKHLLIDKNGKCVGEVLRGMHKAITTDRVILAPGSRKEVKIVRMIFHRYINLGESTVQVANYLNARGVKTRALGPWYPSHIRFTIRNEKYIGTQTFNRTSSRLGTKSVPNDPAAWIRAPNAFTAIISKELFERANEKLARSKVPTNDQVLDKLREAVRKYGVMTVAEMYKRRDVLGPGLFAWRFGSLSNAYTLIGETPRAPHIRRGREKSKRLVAPILAAVLRRLHEDGRTVAVRGPGCHLRIDNRWMCHVHIVRRRTDRAKKPRWAVRVRDGSLADFHLLAREAADGKSILDYYVLSAEIGQTFPTILKARNGEGVDRFRVRELGPAIETLTSLLAGT